MLTMVWLEKVLLNEKYIVFKLVDDNDLHKYLWFFNKKEEENINRLVNILKKKYSFQNQSCFCLANSIEHSKIMIW